MDAKQPIPIRSGWKLELNDAVFRISCDAIWKISQRDRKLRSIRQTIVAGLELLNTATTMDRFFLLKRIQKLSFAGDIVIYVPLGRDELRLLTSVKELIYAQSGDSLTQLQVMVLALLSAAQPVTDSQEKTGLASTKT